MNLGQMLITIGMFVLLMMTVISANRILISNVETESQVDPLRFSSGLANDLLAEILSKPFDQAVVIDTTRTPWRQDTTGIKVTTESGLTARSSGRWGVKNRVTLPDDTTGNDGKYWSRTTLKDIDDYDGYSRIARVVVRTSDTLIYTLGVRVYYNVWTALDDTTNTTQTYFKKVNVTVTQTQYGLTQQYSALASY